jgi:hypothetical protein
MSAPATITSATRKLSAQQVEVLRSLTPGQRIRVVQTIRVGSRKWQATVEGVFRDLNYLATGLTVERVAEDDIVVPVVHFTKDGGEMSSITIDENTSVNVIA